MFGRKDYIALYDKDADTDLNDALTGYISWKWKVPQTLQRRKSPVWFIKVKNLYLDDSTGTSPGLPHMLRLKNGYSENYHTYETSNQLSGPILAILTRDNITGHWTTFIENPSIQISSNVQYLEFDIVNGSGTVLPILSGTGGNLNIILEVEYPEHNEVRDNTVMSYAQSTVGNPPFNRL